MSRATVGARRTAMVSAADVHLRLPSQHSMPIPQPVNVSFVNLMGRVQPIVNTTAEALNYRPMAARARQDRAPDCRRRAMVRAIQR